MTDPDRWDRIAQVTTLMEPVFRELWDVWPKWHCGVTSLLLIPLLRAADEYADWTVRVGAFLEPTAEGGQAKRPHVWCMSSLHELADPTYGQFDADAISPALLARPDDANMASIALRYREVSRLTRSEEDEARWAIESSTNVAYGRHAVSGLKDALSRIYDNHG